MNQVLRLKKMLRRAEHAPPLLLRRAIAGVGVIDTAHRLDFGDDQALRIARNDVQLTKLAPVIARDDREALRLQVTLSQPLAAATYG